MKLLFLLLLFLNEPSAAPDVDVWRRLYGEAVHSEEKARQLIGATGSGEHPVARAYCGAGKILMAKHGFNPLSKYRSFTKGREMLEAAVQSDTANPEVRYLRLSIQMNAPAFLGYSRNIEQDKQFLSRHLPALEDQQLKSIIMKYLKSI